MESILWQEISWTRVLFSLSKSKKTPKTDLSTATALNDPICFPFPSFPAAAGLVLPVKTLRDLGTVGLRCKRHLILAIPKEQPGNSAAQPVSVWRCIFIVCVLCAFPLLLNPENTTDLNPYVKEMTYGSFPLFTGKSFISEIEQGINTYFITDMCKLQFICKIANMERACESNGCNVKGGMGSHFSCYCHLCPDSFEKERQCLLWKGRRADGTNSHHLLRPTAPQSYQAYNYWKVTIVSGSQGQYRWTGNLI